MGSTKATFEFSTSAWTAVAADVLIVPVFQQKPFKLDASLKELDKALNGILQTAIADEKFEGSKSSVLAFRKAAADKVKVRRVVLVGLGEKEKLSPDKVEKAILKATEAVLKLDGLKSLAIVFPAATGSLSPESVAMAMVDGVHQATYKSQEAKEKGPEIKQVLLLTDSAASANLKNAVKQGQALARARSLAKDLTNKPANLKTTDTLVDAAKALGKASNLTTKVESSVSWIQKNMPSFYTVARGSLASDPPKFITVTYKPPGKVSKKLALVGKSVIFDTGGYQVKPGDFMVTMKGDMTGGATVLATMQALSELQPEGLEVTAYLAATPNKIDSDAMIPDSIIDTTCGKKVEIRHTDAEGRLTLIDAVAKAAEAKPEMILTIATLTGSAAGAVGLAIALMGNDTKWRDKVEQAGRAHGEPLQTLDIFESDYEDIKSKLDGADIINTSQIKKRGAQSAAAFVMSGAPEGMPMVHLDIAGADMTGDEKATGISTKTLIQFVLNEAGEPAVTAKAASAPVKPAAKASAKPVAKKPAPKKPAKKAPITKKKKK